MSFSSAPWLLALVFIPLIWWISRQGISAVPLRQAKASIWVRTIILIALVLSLAGVSLNLPDRTQATVFVVDVSDSISENVKADAESFVMSAIEAKPVDALAGVVVFGREPRVELSLQSDPQMTQIATDIDPSRTDISRALRLAGALIPQGTKGRIVVLSDGRQNSGEVAEEIARLRRRGIPVDSMPSGSLMGPDAAALSLKGPGRARVGDELELEANIFSRRAEEAIIRLRRGETVVEERAVSLTAGHQRMSFVQKATESTTLTFTVEVSFPADTVRENNMASASVVVDGPARVLILEGGQSEGDDVAKALAVKGFHVVQRDVSAFPTAQELAGTDAVVLVDVEAARLSDLQVAVLEGFVSDLGRGMVTIGGESSFSLGGYRDTPLEAMLPLESEIKDPRRRPSIAQVLAVDTSGSMGQCHCAGPNMGGDRLAEGPNKTNISREAAAKAIDALNEDDEVGVLAFNTSSKWIIPLQRVPSSEVVRSGLQKMQASGGTSIPQALKKSVDELQGSKASLKHVILFTDGWTNQAGLSEAAADMKSKGITLSVVATGEGTGQELRSMAEAGGGRFYAGRNLNEIPEIFMNEVILAARRYVNEGEFFPAITGSSPTTDRLTETPAILGYVATSAKPSAAVTLAIGELEDPLLATWRRGIGVVTSWTSDAKSRWSARWVGWDGFSDFWSNVVRETLPADPTPGYSLDIEPTDDGLQIAISSDSFIPEGASSTARVLRPDGTQETVALERSSSTVFSGRAGSSEAGTYLVAGELSAGGVLLFRDSTGVPLAYPAEYRPGTSDADLLARISKGTKGRIGIAPERAFDPPPARGYRRVPLAGWLLVLAVVLLPVDVALRRVVVTKEDLADLRPRKKKDRDPQDNSPISELLDAKYRVRQVMQADETS